jgi:hypothetical protein
MTPYLSTTKSEQAISGRTHKTHLPTVRHFSSPTDLSVLNVTFIGNVSELKWNLLEVYSCPITKFPIFMESKSSKFVFIRGWHRTLS